MAWDRKVFRASQDAVGAPGDSAAVNSTDDNTMVALLKGLYAKLAGTITVSLPTGGATSALQTTGNATLTAIDGRVDGIEALLTTIDGRVDGLETLVGATNTALATLNALQAASAATVTALASSATSAQLLAANAARKGLILNNTDANAVLVKFGTTASATSFTVRIPLNGYWEMPKPIYTGRIDAIWEADGAGSLYATEM